MGMPSYIKQPLSFIPNRILSTYQSQQVMNHNKCQIYVIIVRTRLKINLTETKASYPPEVAGKHPTMSQAFANGIHLETPE